MNKLTNTITGTLLTTLLLTVTGAALAHDPAADRAFVKKGWHQPGQHQQHGNQSMPVVEHMMRAIRQLDLNDEQQEKIKAVMHGLKTRERQLMKETRSGHDQLKELIKADVYDEAAVAELAEKEGSLTAERLMSASRAMAEIYSLLTVEQRAKLEVMAAERQAKRAEKRQHWLDED